MKALALALVVFCLCTAIVDCRAVSWEADLAPNGPYFRVLEFTNHTWDSDENWEANFEKWLTYMNQYSGQGYQIMADYDGASCVDMTDGFDCPASTNLGCARPWLTTNGGYIASFELWMNENSDWTTYDWEAVATHEIGHTVGLGHAYDVCPCVADDYPTMSSALLANTNCHSYGNLVGANYKATLSSADIEKIRIKYENAVVDIDAGDGGDIPAPPEVYGNEIVCHPNPFNPSTKIEVFVERDVSLSVNIFNLAGERVYEFATRSGANRHFFEWNGRDLRGLVLPAGLYFVVASSEQFILSEKVTLLK